MTNLFFTEANKSVIDHMWIFSDAEEVFAYITSDNKVFIGRSAFSRQRMNEIKSVRRASEQEFVTFCKKHEDLSKKFAYLMPVEVKQKPKVKSTVFGIKPFKGTVTINKSIGGPRLAAYREDHCRTKFFDKMSFPYHLAVYLRLMPDESGLQFTDKFHDLSNQEVDDLVVDGSEITSIKRTQNGVIVSLNIS